MVQSCNINLISKSDFPKQMRMGAYPIVIVYNGRDHFVPTRPISNIAFNTWKLKKQLGPILGAGLLVAKEIDRSTLDHTLLTSLNEVEACLLKHLPTLSPQANYDYLTQAIDAPTRGPAFDPEVGAGVISAPPASSVPSSGTTPSTSGPSAESEPPPPVQKKGRKPHVCEVCGITKTRKPDMDGHRWFYHQLGDPIQCNIAPCKQRNFSARSALKQHVDNIHNKKFRYVYRDCPYGSDSRDYYLTHRVKKHGMRITSSKTKKPVIFTCPKCKKIFMGPSLLKRHTLRGLCMTRKRYSAGSALECTRHRHILTIMCSSYTEKVPKPGSAANARRCAILNLPSITINFGIDALVFFREPKLKLGGRGRWSPSGPPQHTFRRNCHTSRTNQGTRSLPSPGPRARARANLLYLQPSLLLQNWCSPEDLPGRAKEGARAKSNL